MPVRIQEYDFDVSAEIAALTKGDSDIGAVSAFIGRVRGAGAGRSLASMTLEHYPGMTESELHRISSEAERRFRLSAVSVVHRIGELAPGDNIVLVIACAPHRQDAFEGCAFLIDYLKTQAPFWKKESGSDGEGRWVDARQSDEVATEKWRPPQE
ncbi:MAG: molybdenum cofactor biosynthesis protein MoaE [Hyphomicrobium sp.]